MEDRKERFKRLANLRVNNALKQIELIGNLSNRSSYDSSEEAISKIFSELDSALKIAKLKFKSSKTKKGKFQL